jgi:hypothetical protein
VARDTITIEQTLSLLAAAPQRIAELTADLTPVQLRTAPGPDEWSAIEVLAHLRACADQWGGSIVAMLAEDHPTLRAINPRTWIKQTDYPELKFQPSFQAFAAQRAELLALLRPLPPASWSRGATMRGAGKPLERTVLSQAQRLAIHERPHLKQIESIVKTLRG